MGKGGTLFSGSEGGKRRKREFKTGFDYSFPACFPRDLFGIAFFYFLFFPLIFI